MNKINKEVVDFIQRHAECVLATASPDGKPEAATVLFVMEDDFMLYFGTDKKYRKYRNLLKNKKVAVVVGVAAKEPKTAQIEGEMEFLKNPDDIEKTKKIFEKQNPAMVPFFEFPLIFMKLKPTWLRYIDETKSGAENFIQVIP